MKTKIAMCCIFILALGVSTAFAADILLPPESFELPLLTGEPYWLGELPTDWTGDGDDNTGVLHVLIEGGGLFTTSFGDQAAFSNSVEGLSTTLTDVLEAHMTYTLTVNVAKRTDLDGDYAVELLAGGTVIGSETGTPTETDFSETVEVVVTTGSSHAQLGQALSIHLGKDPAQSAFAQSIFDNVGLSAVFVPPPIPVSGLLGLGLLAGGFAAGGASVLRRKK